MPETKTAKIKILPEGLKDRIRAGEVVERPASVVKELVENSIDAGSKKISVEVMKAGKGLIAVSDDGEGMERDDAFLSLKRHATSKLRSEEDLFDIRTMGFRGEALPSIASVSKMRLVTAIKGEKAGVSVYAEAGEIKETKDAPAAGTTVEVRDLFYNTPARRKFLKRDSTEMMHIMEAVTRLSLSHPGISFSLKAEGAETMGLPRASGTRERLMQIYGAEFLDGLLEAKGNALGVSLHAFVSKKENLRETRSHQYVFINKRPVRDPSVSHAVYSAYEVLPGGSHPVFFISLDIDPKKVDFNVHPTKHEVRFADKDSVYRLVVESIKAALRPKAEEAKTASHTGPPADFNDYGSAPQPAALAVSEPMGLPYRAELNFIYLGDTFLAISGAMGGSGGGYGGLTLIDHHAAHERVLYERLLKGVSLDSHTLLFPKQVKLSPKEYAVIIGNMATLIEFGIEAEDFGHDTVLVRALPSALEEADIRGILSDLASVLAEGSKPMQSLKEAMASRMACHASVRGSRILGPEEMRALLRDLDKAENPDFCPHGRPTRIYYSLDDLKKLFKRK